MTYKKQEESDKIKHQDIIKLIPKHCLKKDLWQSMYYMILDLSLLMTAFWTYQYLHLVVFWNLYGFIMWCVFVVGHDCGHGSFSDHYVINAFCGHICHSVLCVPFWPWAYSHSKHHQYHNHYEKDRSHPWYDRQKYDWDRSFPWQMFVAWFAYLYVGLWDGSHIVPFSPLFGGNKKESIKCVVSTLFVVLFLYIMLSIFGFDIYSFIKYYGGCWTVFAFWLYMVTYMHHHSENGTTTFNNDTWDFLTAALETIDRTYGYGIDDLHHNISDCHVIHHLFYTKIPHYHLKEATTAIKGFLKSNKKYKHKVHSNILVDFFTTHWKQGQFTDLITNN
eukprot:201323_1